MPVHRRSSCWRFILLDLGFLLFAQPGISQVDSSQRSVHFAGAITLTTKGISLIPTFTLGKPAAMFDLAVGGKRLSFEPQLRFSLEGKPWSFIFWWRYKLLKEGKFSLNVGAHPALNFRKETFTENGVIHTVMEARRYLAGELVPNFQVGRSTTVGFYYLLSHGLDPGTVKFTHFLTLNANFSSIPVCQRIYAGFMPQIYFLHQDGADGFYATSTVTLGWRAFPITLQSIINKVIQTDIPGSANFLWNASIIYRFNQDYARK